MEADARKWGQDRRESREDIWFQDKNINFSATIGARIIQTKELTCLFYEPISGAGNLLLMRPLAPWPHQCDRPLPLSGPDDPTSCSSCDIGPPPKDNEQDMSAVSKKGKIKALSPPLLLLPFSPLRLFPSPNDSGTDRFTCAKPFPASALSPLPGRPAGQRAGRYSR